MAVPTASRRYSSTGLRSAPLPCGNAWRVGASRCGGWPHAGVTVESDGGTRQGASRGVSCGRWTGAGCCQPNSWPWRHGVTWPDCGGTNASPCGWRLSWHGTRGTANLWRGPECGGTRKTRCGAGHDKTRDSRDSRDRTAGTTRDSRDSRDTRSGRGHYKPRYCVCGTSPIGFGDKPGRGGASEGYRSPNTGGNPRFSGASPGEAGQDRRRASGRAKPGRACAGACQAPGQSGGLSLSWPCPGAGQGTSAEISALATRKPLICQA